MNSDSIAKPSSPVEREIATVALTRETSAYGQETTVHWKGTLDLPEWIGYVSHLVDQVEPDKQQPLLGSIELCIIATDSLPLNHLGQQSTALEQFLEQQSTIQEKMLLEIWQMFVECYDSQYDDLFSSEDSELLSWEARAEKANNPTEADLAKLKALIGPYTVEVYPTNGEIPVQIMMKFGCWWDPEHGLEVLLENGEIKDIDNEATTRPAALSLI